MSLSNQTQALHPEQVMAKAQAFVDALSKLPRDHYGAVPSAAFGEDCNRLRRLALAAIPKLDARLLGEPVEIAEEGPGQTICRASYVEIETYARQVLEQLRLAVAAAQATRPDVSLHPNTPSADPSGPDKGYDVGEIRRSHSQAYRPWTAQDDAYLRERFEQGASVADLADEFGRQPGGIRSRLKKLGLR